MERETHTCTDTTTNCNRKRHNTYYHPEMIKKELNLHNSPTWNELILCWLKSKHYNAGIWAAMTHIVSKRLPSVIHKSIEGTLKFYSRMLASGFYQLWYAKQRVSRSTLMTCGVDSMYKNFFFLNNYWHHTWKISVDQTHPPNWPTIRKRALEGGSYFQIPSLTHFPSAPAHLNFNNTNIHSCSIDKDPSGSTGGHTHADTWFLHSYLPVTVSLSLDYSVTLTLN